MPCAITQDEFLNRMKEIFGDKFCFYHSVYRGYFAPVTVVCYEHGDFQAKPHSLLRGRGGCPKCMNERRSIEMWLLRREEEVKYRLSKVRCWEEL